MYLKSIEVQGFKSFANKIKFEFHNGITGIVGPNGSGKSNVADAVRWVLGEQSAKQLRGANMQDVIFSGTENRKPQGFAYVAITLDNTDHSLNIEYDIVTVSRRVYRSGESEYQINGHNCRLKDINELFYDTGIGKEGYSIIGQGQIDKILSGKPEDRRELFDEAAGIVKFKRRKNIALKKLENERANLVRVTDILSELEKQVGPLEKQAEAAKLYLKYKEDLKGYDINLFVYDSGIMKSQLQSIKERLQIVTEDLESSRQSFAQMKERYESVENILNELERIIDELKKENSDSIVLKESLEGGIQVLNEQIHTEKMNEKHNVERKMAIAISLKEKDEEKEELSKKSKEYQEKEAVLKQDLTKIEEKLTQIEAKIQNFDGEIASDKDKIMELLNEKSNYIVSLERLDTMAENNNLRIGELDKKLDELLSEIKEQKNSANNYREKRLNIVVEKQQLEEKSRSSQGQLSQKEKELSNTANLLNQTQQEYHALKSKADSLKNLAERYEGYGNSIKRIMETRDRVKGIRGVVADIIQVDKKYEVAIETALGGSIQNIVTDSEQVAKSLIEYLKKNKFGRATFLPLDGITVRDNNKNQYSKEKGVIGMASELVGTDDIYRKLIESLLGRVVVTDTIDNALQLARKYKYSLRIVTLEGELLNAGGSMTGGAFKNASNLLGRRREIEELEEQSKQQLIKYDKLLESQQLDREQVIQIKKTIEDTREKLQELIISENTLRLSEKQANQKQSELEAEKDDVSAEISKLKSQIEQISTQRSELQSKISEIEEKNNSSEASVEEYSKALEKEKNERDELADKSSKLHLEIANISQSDAFTSENLNRLLIEKEKLLEEDKSLQGKLDDIYTVIDQKKKEIDQKENEIKETEKKIQAQQEKIQSQSEKREVHLKEQKAFFEKREEMSQRINMLDKDAYRLNDQNEKLQEKLDTAINYLWSEYEIMPSEAINLKTADVENVTELKKTIADIKNKIKALGNVNVNAIEDFKEVGERYTFMKTQYEDLTKAEESLVKIIDELDVGMRKQFKEKFGEIQAEFDKVFKELFGGGMGTLELMEDEDVIEAGIRIISQPPGKKLQNMMQLSGGEKALTAIALLFAIQNLKPSPFCLLDEIEAALDDSNVGRFSGYLHKLTENTQFIVITHRRGTMVAADRLYGITMQEKGVSTLVSVNLIEKDLDK